MIEREILSLSTQGLTVREIAAFVNKSEDTVKTYKRAVFEKLGVDNISQAVSMAQNFNLI
ncbi:MAG: helix-turn-helix transcriptional regulator [Muribaculaceae bacterium]|nr:helix-turn-helix transcriptional regulator [Muribaculaceae bacterium]